MDIIDFVQDVCGWQLSEWQIKFTRAAYDAIVNDKTLIYTPPRGGFGFQYRTLQALADLFVTYEQGIIKNSVKEKQMTKLKDVLGHIDNDVRLIIANDGEIAIIFQGFQDAVSDKYLECGVLEISINEAMDATIDVIITNDKAELYD